jgi:CubicO group peptidase (beta-lactamase class C family)
MKLVEQGKLGLDQPMGEIAPELREVKVLTGFDPGGRPQTRPPRRPITLRHLLTHTSGFSYDLFNAEVGRYMQHEQLPSISTCRYESLRAPLLFDPGERWEYGIGIDWAGRIVELVSGQKLESYLQENFLRPLGMVDTSFVPRADMRARLVATCARVPGSDSLVRIEFDFPTDGDFHMGGGGLYSTGPDYLRFTRMLLGGGALDGTRVLQSETVRAMGRNAIGEISVPGLESANHLVAMPVEFWPGQVKRWGLSFLLNTEDVPGGRAAWSLAWSGVHNTYFWVDPTRGVTGVLMMQLLPAHDRVVLDTYEKYERALYAGLPG